MTNERDGGDQGAAQVRRATPVDADAIARFQTGSWREAYRGLVPQEYLDRVGVDERRVRWRDRLVSGDREVAVAEQGGAVVGVVSWVTAGTLEGLELASLYVATGHHGTGLASTLLGVAIGTKPAHLWVFEDNPRAQAFYGKHGFVFHGRRQLDPDTGLCERLYVRR
jgi:GNAT superfamily N-acetyltransferase